MTTLNCYHGTFKNSAENIVKSGFISSNNSRDWLGEGVYYFQSDEINGEIGKENAIKWVYKKSNDNGFEFTEYSIIKSVVTVNDDYLLDLTIPAQFIFFHTIREEYIKEQTARNIKADFPNNGLEIDAIIIQRICCKTRIDVAKKYDYIRFPRDVRLKINSRIPNSILVCVKNKAECIVSIIIEKEGVIDVGSKEYL